MKSITNIISIALIGGGVAVFAIVSKPLVASKEADVPLNVLGINHSPYGEVFAMAMQGSIETYFHAANAKGHDCDGAGDCGHKHGEFQSLSAQSPGGPNERMKGFIEGMNASLAERTNPRAATKAHNIYLRRGIEDKLRFAYNLDPGHYGNYNAYHFFLTEPELGTRPALTSHAAKLADDTIRYCLSQRSDPRMALTAAAAAGNVIELMLNDRQINRENPLYTTAQMREVLAVMDQSFALYDQISAVWTENGTWENLSEQRLIELQERMQFTLMIRDGHEKSISRLEGLSGNRNTASSSASRSHQPIH